MTRKVLMYKRFERFWHWAQALLVLGLFYTGLEIRGTFDWIGFSSAVLWHNRLLWVFVALVVLAIFWHFTTGEWKQYLPTRSNLREMVRFYLQGIFRGEPHPVKKSEAAKLNPLQRLTYLGLKIVIFPVQMVTGFLYLYRDAIESAGWSIHLGWVAGVHVFGAFVLFAFVVVHVYLTTTGHTPLSNIRAMVVGWEEIEVDEKEAAEGASARTS